LKQGEKGWHVMQEERRRRDGIFGKKRRRGSEIGSKRKRRPWKRVGICSNRRRGGEERKGSDFVAEEEQ